MRAILVVVMFVIGSQVMTAQLMNNRKTAVIDSTKATIKKRSADTNTLSENTGAGMSVKRVTRKEEKISVDKQQVLSQGLNVKRIDSLATRNED